MDVQHPSFLLSHWQLEVPTTLMTEQILISNQRLSLHKYPPSPSSPILPISHNGNGIGSAEDSKETLHGTKKKQGIWDVANETQRAMHSRHLIMIGMSLKILHSPGMPVTVVGWTFFAQLLVVPLVREYSWVQESYVDRARFFTSLHAVLTFYHPVRIDSRSWECNSLLFCYRLIRLRYDDYSVKSFFFWLSSVLTIPNA